VAGVGRAQEQAAQYIPPQCELNTEHFLVKNATVYLKNAAEERDTSKVSRLLADARRNLEQAVGTDQADNPAAWYFLGRYYVLTDDAPGADSAFDRAEVLAPACAQDIQQYRMTMWVPRINEAFDSLRAQSFAAAKTLLRRANVIYEGRPIGFYYLALLFGQDNELDSARHYFARVAAIGATDSSEERNVRESTFNVAVLFGQADQYDSAAAWYERYREAAPSDPRAMRGLANAYGVLGQPERAGALYDSTLTLADSLSMAEVFNIGLDLYGLGQLGVAARAFELAAQKNPYYRDALYNLIVCYQSVAQDTTLAPPDRYQAAEGMERAARRLVAIEPLGHEAIGLLAASFRLRQLNDSTLAVLERLERLPLGIEISTADQLDGAVKIRGILSNMRSVATTVPTITFEFLDEQGNVLTTGTVPVSSLGPHATTEFEVTGTGEHIAAWRYRQGA
jgi:tetratricopeptide (TPR) repeat protein